MTNSSGRSRKGEAEDNVSALSSSHRCIKVCILHRKRWLAENIVKARGAAVPTTFPLLNPLLKKYNRHLPWQCVICWNDRIIIWNTWSFFPDTVVYLLYCGRMFLRFHFVGTESAVTQSYVSLTTCCALQVQYIVFCVLGRKHCVTVRRQWLVNVP